MPFVTNSYFLHTLHIKLRLEEIFSLKTMGLCDSMHYDSSYQHINYILTAEPIHDLYSYTDGHLLPAITKLLFI